MLVVGAQGVGEAPGHLGVLALLTPLGRAQIYGRVGLLLVLMMLFRPAGILPSAVRKREFEAKRVPG